ncbi:MAG: ligase-associated DNA damage response DEXH box helicase [Phycisphaeraceae bacterium]|nr:ligase-associated DNA damage response DEXH box helicase [Phycisphaeraceae bacterium]
MSPGLACIDRWFDALGWTPWEFQRQAWRASRDGRSGLVHVPTGAGKTHAAYLGPLSRLIDSLGPEGASDRRRTLPKSERGVRILFVTPLRAVARDTELALRAPIEAMDLPFTVGSRTGDTSARERAAQRERLPEVLITTPESLSLLLCREGAAELFARLEAVIVDEWHELMPTKRGVQTELALARLSRWRPELVILGLSATVARPKDAAQHLVGTEREPLIIEGGPTREVVVESLLPESIEAMPWTGHMGLAMVEPLCRQLDPDQSTLIFTNTRSQAERWFMEIMRIRPQWHGRMGLHHGSIALDVRRRVEAGIKDGSLGIVVATSSLDLGVDFAPVERVVQIGSPKGVARLLQRAGRSSHRPGAACRVLCVPTHALELLEIAAAREAIARGEVEARPASSLPLDCLIQHLVTVATGGGFMPDALFEEVRRAWSFRTLSREEFDWAVGVVTDGGRTLRAYERYRRVRREPDGVHLVRDARTARTHRLNVGTISSEPVMTVALRGGRKLGTIEEDFVARLRPGDGFIFAGRALEFIRVHEMTAQVRPQRKSATLTPRWAGSRFPLSSALSASLRRMLDRIATGEPGPPEVEAARPVLEAQARRSRLPRPGETLIEACVTDEGSHLFVYPIEGRLVHEGLAALLALRLGRRVPATFTIMINDFGFELLTRSTDDLAQRLVDDASLWSTDGLVDDLREAVLAGDLSLRQFREIARVAGLVQERDIAGDRGARQLHAGASLLYQVFREFEPTSPLLKQAEREVLERQFEEDRLVRTLERLRREPRILVRMIQPGPLAWPLIAERTGVTSLSTESLGDRLAALLSEAVAGPGAGAPTARAPRRRSTALRSRS